MHCKSVIPTGTPIPKRFSEELGETCHRGSMVGPLRMWTLKPEEPPRQTDGLQSMSSFLEGPWCLMSRPTETPDRDPSSEVHVFNTFESRF